jgi:transposase-like protein
LAGQAKLGEKGGGEVTIPAYAAMQENGLSERMLDVLMRGISTRQYAEVLPEMASSCGVSKSNVSREAAEASEEALKELLERRFDEVDLLVIYIDGMMFGEHHVISAVGVDGAGHKHVLGIQSGATENTAAVEDLLRWPLIGSSLSSGGTPTKTFPSTAGQSRVCEATSVSCW